MKIKSFYKILINFLLLLLILFTFFGCSSNDSNNTQSSYELSAEQYAKIESTMKVAYNTIDAYTIQNRITITNVFPDMKLSSIVFTAQVNGQEENVEIHDILPGETWSKSINLPIKATFKITELRSYSTYACADYYKTILSSVKIDKTTQNNKITYTATVKNSYENLDFGLDFLVTYNGNTNINGPYTVVDHYSSYRTLEEQSTQSFDLTLMSNEDIESLAIRVTSVEESLKSANKVLHQDFNSYKTYIYNRYNRALEIELCYTDTNIGAEYQVVKTFKKVVIKSKEQYDLEIKDNRKITFKVTTIVKDM